MVIWPTQNEMTTATWSQVHAHIEGFKQSVQMRTILAEAKINYAVLTDQLSLLSINNEYCSFYMRTFVR